MSEEYVKLVPDDPKKAKRGLLIFSAVFLFCLFLFFALAAKSISFAQREIAPQIRCNLAFENVRDAILYYAEMNDGYLPRAENWQDELYPYLVKTYYAASSSMKSGLDLPGDWGCKLDSGQMTGIAFNEELSGASLRDIKDLEGTILLFEIEKPSRNAHGTYPPKGRPPKPITNWSGRQWLRIGILGYEKASGSITNSPMRGR